MKRYVFELCADNESYLRGNQVGAYEVYFLLRVTRDVSELEGITTP
jgi:hypothetical protein